METKLLLKEYLLKEHSKRQCLHIVEFIGNDKRRFRALMNLLLQGNSRITQRAAWPLSILAETKPAWFTSYISMLLPLISREGVHGGVRRNVLRILQHLPVPVKHHGRLMDLCFRLIATPEEPVAVKAFCLSILENLCGVYPEIVNELLLLIDERWDHETAAFHSRARKVRARYAIT